MSNLTNFKNFITESSDRAELKAMGFTSDLPFNKKLSNTINDWYKDPEINDAIQVITTRAEELMLDNDINTENDPTDSFEWHKEMRRVSANHSIIDPILKLIWYNSYENF